MKTTINIELDDESAEFLNSGQIYFYGRDHAFRPILIFSVAQLDVKKVVQPEFFIKFFTNMFEYVIQEMLIPGQVENWVIIIDLKGMSLWTIPYGGLGAIIKFASASYRNRVFRVYIVNAPWSITVPWVFAKKMMNEVQIAKVIIQKKKYDKKMGEHIRMDQLEEKFGGTQKDLVPGVK